MWVLDDTQIPNQIWDEGNAIQQHSVLPNEQAVPSSAPAAELEIQVLLRPRLYSHSAECQQQKATLCACTVTNYNVCMQEPSWCISSHTNLPPPFKRLKQSVAEQAEITLYRKWWPAALQSSMWNPATTGMQADLPR